MGKTAGETALAGGESWCGSGGREAAEGLRREEGEMRRRWRGRRGAGGGKKMGAEVQFGGGAEYGFCRNFVNLFGNALR